MVLGLFDNLSSGPQSKTPSRHASLLAVTDNVQATPSRRPSSQNDEAHLPSTGKRHRKSPLSASKQTQLNTYLTPFTNRILKHGTPGSRGSVSKLRFDDTPAFLRRDSQRNVPGKENEGLDKDISWSPVAVRKIPKAYAGKRLSALVQGLRDMEEERLDEELDMLREMEDSDAPTNQIQPKILVNDSQRPDMPLGPDGDIESEDEISPHEGKGRGGNPLKVWKKKGQKRTSRKVVMRPNAAKWKPEPAWEHGKKSEDEGDEALVEGTQVLEQRSSGNGQDHECNELDTENEIEHASEKTKTEENKKGRKDGLVKKVKKINVTAHANFRALKIKNKQSKGKRGSRFGRKR